MKKSTACNLQKQHEAICFTWESSHPSLEITTLFPKFLSKQPDLVQMWTRYWRRYWSRVLRIWKHIPTSKATDERKSPHVNNVDTAHILTYKQDKSENCHLARPEFSLTLTRNLSALQKLRCHPSAVCMWKTGQNT